MNRVLALLLAAIMTFSGTAACAEGEPSNVIREYALTIAQSLNAMAEEDFLRAYVPAYTGSDSDEIIEHVQSFDAAQRTEPVQVISLCADMGTIWRLLAAIPDIPEIPGELEEALIQQLIQAVPTMLNLSFGVTAMTTQAIISQSAVFAAPGPDGVGAYLLLYDKGASVLVTWYRQENAVNMSAHFLELEIKAAELDALKAQLDKVSLGEFWGCEPACEPAESAPVVPLKDRAVALAEQTASQTARPEMQDLLGASEEVRALMNSWAAGDRSQPSAMYAVDMTGLDQMAAGTTALLHASGAPEGLGRNGLTMLGMLRTHLLARQGTEELAASSMAMNIRIYADETADGSGAYLLMYDGAMPMLVTWQAINGAVYMTASFMPFEELAACQTAAEASLWLAGKGMPVPLTNAEAP